MKEATSFLNNLLKNGDTIVLGLSGGPDSMCLFHVLISLKDKYNLKIICAHVNHNVRPESEREAIFVEDICLKNKVAYEYFKIDSYENNKFSEQEARKKRYNFFYSLMDKYKANYLMTAHHGDDLVETIMMRIVRGSTIKGYLGIPFVTKGTNYCLVRPLLFYSKQDIINYLDSNNIEYVIDKSNENELWTRNRFRKQMLPFLKKEDKNVHLRFLEYSKELEMANDYINRVVDNKFNNIVNNNSIDINILKNEDEYIQKRIVERLIETLQKDNIININKEQFNNIINLINNKKNVSINLSDDFIARRSYDKLFIEVKKDIVNYRFIFNEELTILNKYIFKLLDNSKEKSNYVIRLDSSEIKLPLIIRPKEDGDKIKVKNLSGSKKVKDIFIDNKMDIKKRNEYPIVLDSSGTVIWIPGIKKSIFDKEINEKYDIIIKYVEENHE
jgi:tRNA(Ile)-lysidine synthetase-like protein